MDNKDHYKKINKRFEQFPKNRNSTVQRSFEMVLNIISN